MSRRANNERSPGEREQAIDRLQLARAVSIRLQIRQRTLPLVGSLALRMRRNGLRSALVGGRVGNSAWGRRMAAKKGGLALKRLRPSHYRAIGRLGVAARRQRAKEEP